MATAKVTRKFDRWAYPRNGNTWNPSAVFLWVPEVEGEVVCSSRPYLHNAVEFIEQYYPNVTSIEIVREPLPENPWLPKATA